MEQLANILISLLVGGFSGTVLTLLIGCFSEKTNRRIQFLNEQLTNLYGPLYYLVKQNEKLFELNNRLHEAYTKEFVEKKWSEAPATQEKVHADAVGTLDLMNKYISQVEPNNAQIRKILDEKFAYSDPEDIDVFMLFFEHQVRLATERDESGKLSTPYLIYKHLGEISFLRPEVIEKMKEKYLSKRNELLRLINNSILQRRKKISI